MRSIDSGKRSLPIRQLRSRDVKFVHAIWSISTNPFPVFTHMTLSLIEKSPCIRNWTSAEYHAHPALSRSRLWSFYESARKYNAEETGEIPKKKATDAMHLGSLVHAMLFEPDELKQFKTIPVEFLSSDGKATTKAAKQFIDDYADKTVVPLSTYETAERVRDSLLASQFGQWLKVKDAKKELSIQWTDEETGLDMRCRVDLLIPSPSGLFVGDLKTTQDASPKGFRYSCKDYGYWMQYAFYLDGIQAATGVRPQEWYFVAAATKPPYEVCFHHFDVPTKAMAVERYRECLHDFADAKASGEWRSKWDNDLNVITLRDFDF